jgi:SAM-dependent methyltransferase
MDTRGSVGLSLAPHSTQGRIMDMKSHWDSVYQAKLPEAVSWYAPHLWLSLHYARKAASWNDAAIIDVGGGESTLVDDLLAQSYSNITVLDISATALEVTQHRLGALSSKVAWLVGDVLDVEFPVAAYDVWHDRAVFHFLTGDEQRQRYVEQVLRALKPGGHAIVGAFGPEGPEKCSGLPVARYGPDALHASFGAPFELVDSSIEVHQTPWGTPQQFAYCFCKRHDHDQPMHKLHEVVRRGQ